MSARLLARDHPDWDVDLFERLEPADTFGFGVGLTRGLLFSLLDAAPAIHDDFLEASVAFSSASFRLPNGVGELPSYHAGAISRARMLQLLLDSARQEGVRIHIGASPTVDDLRFESDLVIAADGVSSLVREQFANEFGAHEELGRGWFIWCGAEIELDGTVFLPVTTDAGTFVAHAYPYAPGLATFVIETDPEALSRAGCQTGEFDGEGASDDASLQYLSEAFRELLGGQPLLGNHSRWMHFRTITCDRWSYGNVVLLGDAAATAHPSIGSGTKLALEAAIALAESLDSVGDDPIPSRLPAFERALRTNVERLQDRARRSQLWWESFPTRMTMSPAQIAFAYLSRAGAVSLEQLADIAPELAARVVADFADLPTADVPPGGLPEWVLHRPLQFDGHALPQRIVAAADAGPGPEVAVDLPDPWSPSAQVELDRIAGLINGGSAIVTLTGTEARSSLLDRLAFGERVRRELGATVAVTCNPAQLGDAVDGLVCGRTDLVRVSG